MSRKESISYSLHRLLSFLKVFASNKRGIAGLAILIFFIFLAVAGPYMTPYHPILSTNLAGRSAAPTWLRYFPGGERLSQNVEVVPNSGFTTPDTLKEWNFTFSPPSGKGISVRYDPIVGNPSTGGSGPGSVIVTFKREQTGTIYGNTTLYMTRDFYYPYTGEPGKFSGAIALAAEGTGDVRTVGKDIAAQLDVPAKIDVFIKIGDDTYYLWPQPLYPAVTSDGLKPITTTGEIKASTASTWITSDNSPIDSGWPGVKARAFGSLYSILDPAKVVFNSSRIPNTFTYGVRIIFEDTNVSLRNKKVETSISIDDFHLNILGTSFGLLGTDQAGRDLFTQLVRGAALSLYVGILSSILGVVIGLVVGLVSGYLGSFADEIMMRLTDVILIIPSLVLLIVLVAVLGATLNNLILLLALLGWPSFARTVRSQVLSLKERPFVEAAKAIGSSKVHIMSRHILPNVMSLVYVTMATSVPGAIVSEAALSWLGFNWGYNVVSWGFMLREAQQTSGAIANWWWVVPPGLCIALIALSFILLGFALDEVLNPKLRIRR